jgi:hypothetical protein
MRWQAAAAILVLMASCARAADPLTAEIERLHTAAQSLDEKALHELMRGMIAPARDAVTRARNTDDPLLQLYRLREAHVMTETLTWFAAHRAESQNAQLFDELWHGEKSRFEAPPPAPSQHVVQNALSQAARNRAEKLFRASLPYGRVTSPFNGVYYLGEAHANLSFATFVESLPDSDEDRGVTRSTVAALTSTAEALETETLTFFAADPTARAAIPVSAKLKEARELIAARAVDGATLALLETRLELALRQNKAGAEAVAPDAPKNSMGRLSQALYGELMRSRP